MKVSKVIRQVLVLLLGSSGIGLQAAEVVDLRMWRAPDHTRLVLDLSDAVEYSSFLLEDPHRLVVDIKSSFTDLSFNGLDLSDSPISGIRGGERNGDSLRIVLDLTSAVEPETLAWRPTANSVSVWCWTSTIKRVVSRARALIRPKPGREVRHVAT